MTYETGVFHEVYKYAKNFNLPIHFIIEDNGLSTNTPTKIAWGKRSKILKNKFVSHYKYKRNFPITGLEAGYYFEKKYKNELIKSMEMLSKKKKTVFLGQSVMYSGNAIYNTLVKVPKKRK